jgi:hypothetical protein
MCSHARACQSETFPLFLHEFEFAGALDMFVVGRMEVAWYLVVSQGEECALVAREVN